MNLTRDNLMTQQNTDLLNRFLKITRRFQNDEHVGKKATTAHGKLKLKALVAKTQDELNAALPELVKDLPQHWAPKGWTAKLLRNGQHVRITTAKKSELILEGKFEPIVMAKIVGTILGAAERASQAEDTRLQRIGLEFKGEERTYMVLYRGSLQNQHTGMNLHEAIAKGSLTQQSISGAAKSSYFRQETPQAAFENAHKMALSRFNGENTHASLLPSLLDKVLAHPFYNKAGAKTHTLHDDIEHLSALRSHSIDFGKFLNTFKAKKWNKDNQIETETLHAMESFLVSLLRILDLTKPRSGTTKSWIVYHGPDSTHTVEAWDGRSAILISVLHQFAQIKLPTDWTNWMAFEAPKAFQGAQMFIDEHA